MKSKYNARKAIFNALINGRHLSQMDCREFQVEDMRTPISHIKHLWRETHDLMSRWILTPTLGRRIKEYWLEPKVSAGTL